MKKIISLLLVCLMVVPFGMLATTSISAAGKTIYVSDAGDDTAAGDAATPVKTIVKASELVGAEGGTIVISGTVTTSGDSTLAAHTGTVTIKGADANAKLVTGGRFYFNGPIVIDDLYIDVTRALALMCNYNDFTFGEGVTMPASKAVGGAQEVYLVGGHSGYKTTDTDAKDVTLNIKGAGVTELIGMFWKDAADEATCDAKVKNIDVTINLEDKAVVNKIFFFSRSGKWQKVSEGSTCTLNLNGGKVNNFIGAHDNDTKKMGYGGGATINIGKNFKFAESFQAATPDATTHLDGSGVFQGVSGDTVWGKADVTYETLANTKVVLDADIFDTLKDSTLLRVAAVEKKAGGTVTPPETGDMTWVVAAVAAVSVMGCAVVVAKKRAN